MNHSHAHGHHHGHGQVHDLRAGNARRMWLALAVNMAMLGAAAAGAVVTGSLALLADAGHVLTDVGAIALALGAAAMATRPARGRGTFGFGRAEIFAALLNGIVLVAISVWIAVEAIGRLAEPRELDGIGVLAFGLVGLAGNALAVWMLVGGARSDVNLEGALRHSVADALGSLGVIVAGAGIAITGWQRLDPVVSLLIALLILMSSWRLLREPANVLMERAPIGVDVATVGRAMAAVPGVREVHDLHIWSITSGFPALAAHVTVSPKHEPEQVRRAVESLLENEFEIEHTTLQIAVEPLLQLDSYNGSPSGSEPA